MKGVIVFIFFLVGVGAVFSVVAASAPSASRTPNGRMAVRVFAPRGGPGPSCARFYPLRCTVSTSAVLTGAMRALLAGPSAATLFSRQDAQERLVLTGYIEVRGRTVGG